MCFRVTLVALRRKWEPFQIHSKGNESPLRSKGFDEGFEPKSFCLGRKGSYGTQIQDEGGIVQMLQSKQIEILDKI